MPLYRFHTAAIRLDRVAAIKEVPGEPGPDGKAPLTVKVTFLGAVSETFTGRDAEAIRDYIGRLPDAIDEADAETDITPRTLIQGGKSEPKAPRRRRRADGGESPES